MLTKEGRNAWALRRALRCMYGCRALAELAYTDASLSDRLIAVPFMPALGGKSDARRDQCC
jgi:hypothetical protein